MKHLYLTLIASLLILNVSAQTCTNNLVANPGFNSNTFITGDGSMPGSTTDSWLAPDGSPQLYNSAGCNDYNFISAWGNDAVGEAVSQNLSTPLQAAHTYTLTFCAFFTKSATPSTAPQLVRLRLRGSNAPMTDFPCTSGCEELVISADITDTSWQTYTYTFTPAQSWNTITFNPENGSSVLNGAYVSWIGFDNVCIEEIAAADCSVNNMIANGGFNSNTYITGDGSMPASHTDAWHQVGNTSPQLYSTWGCQDTHSISMWGNDAVGEGIWQQLSNSLQSGQSYTFTICGRWSQAPTPSTAPQHTSVRLRGSNMALTDINCSAYCQEMVLSADISDTSWQSYSYTFVPSGNWNYITISPNNGSTALNGAYVSWLNIDNICISPTSPTSIAQVLKDNEDIKIYPNPVNDLLNVELTGNATEVNITNLLGQQILRQSISNKKHISINVHNLPKGIYLISIKTEEGTVVRKIVKE